MKKVKIITSETHRSKYCGQSVIFLNTIKAPQCLSECGLSLVKVKFNQRCLKLWDVSYYQMKK